MSTQTNPVFISDEQLADFYDDGHARRAQGVALYVDGRVALLELLTDRVIQRSTMEFCGACGRVTQRKCMCGAPICDEHAYDFGAYQNVCAKCLEEMRAEQAASLPL